jgi:hypothetical protein
LRPCAVPAVVHQDIAGITASPDNSAAMATPPAESANSVTLSARRFQTVHADKAFAVRFDSEDESLAAVKNHGD